MRELKFRSWDGFYKKMNYNPIISDGTDGGETASVRMNYAIDCFDGVLMQYTGLKDKNGKEIYEGDIVKFSADYIKPVIVYWNDEMTGFYPLLSTRSHTLTIVGNIYEHPELTKHDRL